VALSRSRLSVPTPVIARRSSYVDDSVETAVSELQSPWIPRTGGYPHLTGLEASHSNNRLGKGIRRRTHCRGRPSKLWYGRTKTASGKRSGGLRWWYSDQSSRSCWECARASVARWGSWDSSSCVFRRTARGAC